MIFTVFATTHIDNSFHITGLHLHQDGNTHRGIPFLQAFNDCLLGQVLHTHINSGHHVCAINRRLYRKRNLLIEHLLFVLDAILSTQNGVIGQLDAKTGRVFSTLETADITYRTLGQ